MPYSYDHPRPSVAVDIVLLSVDETGDAESVLLIERGQEPFKGDWALPGGFVEIDEDLHHAAYRELEEETGIAQDRIELFQLRAFGAPDRDPRGRVISVAFTGTVRGDHRVAGGNDAAHAQWHKLDSLPDLAFDHAEIVLAALAFHRRSNVTSAPPQHSDITS